MALPIALAGSSGSLTGFVVWNTSVYNWILSLPRRGSRTILILEHDAKTLLAKRGLPVPEGALWPVSAPVVPDFPPPWVLKAQVPVGGRGKAGGIVVIPDRAALAATAHRLSTLRIKGFPVEEIRIEAAVSDAREIYLGLVIDAATGRVSLLASATGGVEIEAEAGTGIHQYSARPEAVEMTAALDDLAAALPSDVAAAVRAAGEIAIAAFLDLDATLLELNPIFLKGDGSWIAGDVRLDLDENALPRQPEFAALLDARPHAYAEAVFKRDHGFDLVIVDPEGEIGLVTTGAGLSMQLIDEMSRRGLRPYNFCDIRSGMMRGSPDRLIATLRQLCTAPRLRCVLVNIFAGITDLGEFADLLLAARAAVPELQVPMVVRLVGNGQERAEAILGAAEGLELIPDLDRAVTRIAALCDA